MSDAGRLYISVEADFNRFDAEFKKQTAAAEVEATRAGQVIGRNLGDAIKRELQHVAKAVSMIGLAFLAVEGGVAAARIGVAAMRQDVEAMEKAVTELPFGLGRFGQLAVDINNSLLGMTEVGRVAMVVSRVDISESARAERLKRAADEQLARDAKTAELIDRYEEELYRKRIAQKEQLEREAEERRRRNIADGITYQMQEYERAFENQQRREELVRKAAFQDRVSALQQEIDATQIGSAEQFVTRAQTATGSFAFGQKGSGEQIVAGQKRIEALNAELVRLQREELELARARQLEAFR